MKAGVEGRAELTPSFVQHFDRCLGCLACVTACPSGVQYGPLIEKTRAQIEQRYERGRCRSPVPRAADGAGSVPAAHARGAAAAGDLRRAGACVGRALMAPRRRRLRRARRAPRRAAAGEASLLRRIAAALALAPPVTWRSLFRRIPEHTPAAGESRDEGGRADRLRAAAVVRRREPAPPCACWRPKAARVDAPGDAGLLRRAAAACRATSTRRAQLARHNIEVFERAGVDRIVVNAAGCGSAMKEYGELFADDPAWAARAHAFSAKVRDVSEVLAELGEPRAPRQPDSRARRLSRRLSPGARAGRPRRSRARCCRRFPASSCVTPAESEICCGSAGIYNLVQPEPAAQLGARKARNIAALSPDMIATGKSRLHAADRCGGARSRV